MSQNSNGKVAGENPDTEVVAKAKRRQYMAEYKLRILREVEACKGSGEIGRLAKAEAKRHNVSGSGGDSNPAAEIRREKDLSDAISFPRFRL